MCSYSFCLYDRKFIFFYSILEHVCHVRSQYTLTTRLPTYSVITFASCAYMVNQNIDTGQVGGVYVVVFPWKFAVHIGDQAMPVHPNSNKYGCHSSLVYINILTIPDPGHQLKLLKNRSSIMWTCPVDNVSKITSRSLVIPWHVLVKIWFLATSFGLCL